MSRNTILGAGALLALATLGAGTVPLDGGRVGEAAPEITSEAWFNHIGQPLTLAKLRGQAVLIEFWATW